MPYKKNFRGRRTYGKRRYKPKPSWMGRTITKARSLYGTAQQAWKMGRLAMSLVNTETKYAIVNQANAVAQGTTWSSAMVNLIAQGSDVNQRNGNSIMAKHMKLKLLANGSAAAATTNIRVCVFVDRENTGSLVSMTSLFSNNGGAGGLVITDQLQPDASDRIWMLRDQVYTISNTGTNSLDIDMYIPLPFHIKFDGTGSTTADTSTNAVIVAWVCDQSVNNATFTIQTKIAYIDN